MNLASECVVVYARQPRPMPVELRVGLAFLLIAAAAFLAVALYDIWLADR